MKNPMLVILAGLPAAGKSSFAHHLGLLMDEAFEVRTMVIASDTVREEFPALREGFIPELEEKVRMLTLERVKAALRSGLSVIHDDLNYYRSMRFDLVGIARELEAPHALIHIATPMEVCLEWNAVRGRKVPDVVITKDAARFDTPGGDPWDEPLARVNVKEMDAGAWNALMDRLRDRIERFRPWTPREKKPHAPTRAEELDLLSRKVVGDFYRTGKARKDGKEISRIRQELVEQALADGASDGEAESLFRKRLGGFFSVKD